ncbi:hypothetical protein [Actinoplanes friuliensis]|uniref:Uncharacterized protein n=1 Tax=Actinoplanes friuliensis DSM 7358 TaxID=1246995 RepID=U5W1T7_9ACTN|nr:hypothetical protein [Actinoplanes friuliensis]AGZ43059.1 hypothetical protein AFR_23955 [Actinoplanes friuliensis DSM 7358]
MLIVVTPRPELRLPPIWKAAAWQPVRGRKYLTAGTTHPGSPTPRRHRRSRRNLPGQPFLAGRIPDSGFQPFIGRSHRRSVRG